ncbi:MULTISPECIES: pseudouridine synthase [Agathobacter]|uniref:Pseudouridine synthase n=1 Tax=Agathobacter ruminis TaxID=1712665 RepID=A0A2G3E3D7_9FIRM|nr:MULTISPECIES: pseudouridine synthase [Agathobacter]MBQ1681244.1 pseudouridine synthase [Agathobacter sp.]MDC7302681.1 pseudouridine synthase [Agathobacter ruminis]PHU37759.1 23S rRNA pseudouridine synthase F [Agathobacter ruminis]
MESVRINKYLSEAGICSRREADRQLEAGNIYINNQMAKPGDRVNPGDEVRVNGQVVHRKEAPVLLAFYKPVGIVCTAQKREKQNVIDYINYETRIYPVGRLDKESEGLLLLTNQGELSNRIQKARNYHEKEYIVTVNRNISESFLNGMSHPVPLAELNTSTRPCKVRQIDKRTFSIILTQGLNRQIRRMCDYFGYRVVKLKRIRVMNIVLDGLQPGEYRKIEGEEYETLLSLLGLKESD